METLNGIHSNAAGLKLWLDRRSGDGGPADGHPHPHA
jgi:hypothetical protein